MIVGDPTNAPPPPDSSLNYIKRERDRSGPPYLALAFNFLVVVTTTLDSSPPSPLAFQHRHRSEHYLPERPGDRCAPREEGSERRSAVSSLG